VLLRVASPALGPVVLATLRLALATGTLAVIMLLLKHRWPRSHWKEVFGLGILTAALPFLFFSYAALTLPAGYIALFNTTAVLFGTLAAAWLREDTLTWRKLAGGGGAFSRNPFIHHPDRRFHQPLQTTLRCRLLKETIPCTDLSPFCLNPITPA